ncbi:MAG: nitroreductase family protein [Flavobacteriaceae bacterium]
MSINPIIRQRRSIFPAQYSAKPIAKATLKKLLEAANWAPTHRKTEPWRFQVIQGEFRSQLGRFLAEQYKSRAVKYSEFKYKKTLEKPQQAAAVIVINMQRDPEERVPEWEEVAATAMAVQNLWLQATELGLGGYWSSPASVADMGELLEMAPGEKCLGLFYLGHFDGPPPERTPESIADKVKWLGE